MKGTEQSIFGLILSVKTCHLHEWHRTKKTKKLSQNNRQNKHNSDKTKKNFTGIYTEVNPIFVLQQIVHGILEMICILKFVKIKWMKSRVYIIIVQ